MENLMQELQKYGIINMSDMLEQLEHMKKKELLDKHNFKVWQGKDGKWRTYLPDPQKGRRLIKKSKREDIDKEIMNYYKQDEKPQTFRDCYFAWRSVHDKLVSENSVYRYETDYKRYFEHAKFSDKVMKNISEDEITIFMVDTVKEKKLCQKATKTLYWYISSVCVHALKNKVISENPCLFLSASIFYKYSTEHERRKDKLLVSNAELKILLEQIQADYNNQPEYIPTYAVHFAMITGMRVGEISALTWDCIYDDYILINKSEKYNRKTKEYYIDRTKNKKDRMFPMTQELKALITRLKRVEMENGYFSKWVFSNADGRVHAPVISSCSKNKCRQLGIEEKGIHAYRRTINSQMEMSNIPPIVRASLLGHTEAVNKKYYTYDIMDMETKKNIVSSITAKIS